MLQEQKKERDTSGAVCTDTGACGTAIVACAVNGGVQTDMLTYEGKPVFLETRGNMRDAVAYKLTY